MILGHIFGTQRITAEQFSVKKRGYGNKNYKFHIPTIKSNLLKRNIIYQGPKVWNSISFGICSKKSISCFKYACIKKLDEKKHIPRSKNLELNKRWYL